MVDTYYGVLGVPIDADTQKIKTAFRSAAKACHPDHHRDNSNSEQRFKRIVAAYAVVGDPTRRARYDRELRDHNRRRRKRTIVDCAISSLVSASLVVAFFLVLKTFGIPLRSIGPGVVSKAEEVQSLDGFDIPKLEEVLPARTSEFSKSEEIVPVEASEVTKLQEIAAVHASRVSKALGPVRDSVAEKPSPDIRSHITDVAERSASLQVIAAAPREQIGRAPGTTNSIDRQVGAMPTRISRTSSDEKRVLRADGDDPLASSARRRSGLKFPVEKQPGTTSKMTSGSSTNRDGLKGSQVVAREAKRGFCLVEWRYYSPKVLWHIGECGDGADR